MNGLALCAGVGGLELGLRIAIGDAYRCVGYVEREGYAAALLVARMEDQALDPAPVWNDLATFDGKPWSGLVDIVSSGFPCQPSSTAGARKGIGDDRWLWPHIKRIIREVRPRLVFLENVPGLLNVNHGRAFASILGDLAELGYDAEWDVFSAKGVGAPHLRKRVFILARLADAARDLRRGPQRDERRVAHDGAGDSRGGELADTPGQRFLRAGLESDEATARVGRTEGSRPRGAGGNVADASGISKREPHDEASPIARGRDARTESGGGDGGLAHSESPAPARQSSGDTWEERTQRSDGEGADLEHADGTRLQGRQPPGGFPSPDELPPWPPSPADLGAWGEVLQRWPWLEPAVANPIRERRSSRQGDRGVREAKNDGPEGPAVSRSASEGGNESDGGEARTQSNIRRVADGMAPRVDRLRAAGNGVVPVVAAVAFLHLAERLGVRGEA